MLQSQMRARPSPVESLVILPQLTDAGERRAGWRQAIAALSQSTRLVGPPALDGVDLERLGTAVAMALESGLADDLDWIAPGSAAVALYEIMAALPAGRPRRELGRRVFARLYEGTAATFAAVATRMAFGSGRSLEAATMRARMQLVFDLPVGSAVNADPLALTLVTRRELHERWVESPSFGALPARRMAAKLLEHAAREAVVRSQQGDPHPLEIIVSERVRPAFRRLLADREPLVWRHAAVARGLLATVDTNLRDEMEQSLDPALTPTEWRRAVVSLVATLCEDPGDGLKSCKRVLEGEIGQRDPGIAATIVLGLPRVVEEEPDVASDLLNLLAALDRPDVAEATAALLSDVANPSFGIEAAQRMRGVLEERAAARASLLPGIAARALNALDIERASRETVQEDVRQALVAYETTGARAALELAAGAIAHAEEVMEFLAGHDPLTQDEHLPAVLSALSDLDASALERSRLADLLLLGRRPGDTDASVPEIDKLHNRLGDWLLQAQERARQVAWTRALHLADQRCLRVLLHMVDHETTQTDSAAAGARTRVRRAVKSLIERLSGEPDPAVHRILCATLARSFDAAVREGVNEAADLLLAVGQLLTDPHSIETIADASTNPEVSGPLMAYARFVNPPAEEGEDRSGDGFGRDEEAVRDAERMLALSRHVNESGTYRGEALRQTVFRLARSLHATATARGLSELVDASNGLDSISELESATDALRKMTQSALTRVTGTEIEPISVLADVAPISALIERAVGSGVPANEHQTSMAIRELTAELPAPIADAISRILGRIGTLPVAAASDVYTIPLEKRRAALPDWLLPRRTIGAFYVVRALGTGGVSSVFVARRLEERHNPRAEAFALKVPVFDPTTARSLSEQQFLDMFRDEAGALLSLPQHDNLARFVTFDLAARPKPILVMELIEGAGMDRLIRSRSLETDRVVRYLDGILLALENMHRVGIGHLDVKPSNVILRAGAMPVLVDFGLSGRHLRPGCGTLEYCAPEILGVVPKGHTPTPAPADMYGFACMAYELLTATLLFEASDEMALMSAQISHDGWPDKLRKFGAFPEFAELAVVLAACLRRDPRQRPTAAETRVALSSIAPRLAHVPWPLTSAHGASSLSA
jgi:hypothetical protein